MTGILSPILGLLFILAPAPTWAASTAEIVGPEGDRIALRKTLDGLKDGFARGDLDAVMAYHHPDVIKALAYDKLLVGRDALKADMAGTFKAFRLEFVSDEIESFVVIGDLAIEQSRFVIRGTPRAGGEPFLFRGRSQVIYRRYAASPSGWASFREIIQPGG
jgi:ketosteroid isomerase-like protein